jgi:hypothetical protein
MHTASSRTMIDRDRQARALWLQVTATGAVAMTALDAILLQKKKGFFTGGFLATTHTESVAEAIAFLIVSLLADAVVIGSLVVVALWLTSRLRLTVSARRLAALIVGLTPLVIADFVAYRLVSYLGDAFDLSLMFDLTGRKPSEILAVASGHLLVPVVAIGIAGAAAGVLVWVVNRRNAAGRETLRVPLRVALAALTLALLATAATVAAGAVSETFDDGLNRKPSGRLLGAVAERVTDVDRDGYGIGGKLGDPDPFNSAVYPYALDVPGNGIDEDGVAGDLPAGAPAYAEGTAAQPWLSKPNVILIVLESFRADAVGRVLNGKPVTPVLNALARTGVSATMAFSQNGYTAQSRFHIFSGSLADLRGHRTLIDDFKANGYEVGYFSGQDDSFGGPAYSVGFERADVAYDARQDRARRYTTFTTAGSLAVPFERVQEKVAGFLEKRDRSRPLFLYVNFHDTHYPYHHDGIRPLLSGAWLRESQIEPSQKQALQEMYFNTAANVDGAVGSTIGLATRALGSTPAIIVMSDHGESLFDEGFLGHGYALNDVQTRIPLIVANLPLSIAEPFGQSDLRDAIAAAMAKDAAQGVTPRVVTPEGKVVFQYLGAIDRPRQIAFAGSNGRTIYDFRTRRVSLLDGTSHRPDELQGKPLAQFVRLVHFWERMMVARAAGDSAPSR